MNGIFFALLLLSSACTSCSNVGKGSVFDPNGNTAIMAVDIAQVVLKEQQPLVNAAIAELPDDMQTLAQLAYAALQAFVSKIDTMQPTALDIGNPNTVANTDSLKLYAEDVKAQLDSLIH